MHSTSSATRSTLWLDVGGVLFRNVIEETPFLDELAVRWNLPGAMMRDRYARAQDALEVGQGTLASLWSEIRAAAAGADDQQVAASIYRTHLCPHDDAWRFATSVAARWRLVVTNNEIREWDVLREEVRSSAVIRYQKFSSFELGVAKPSVRFFEECLARLRVHPSEVLYFDDDPDSVAAAAALGVSAHLWTTAAAAGAICGVVI